MDDGIGHSNPEDSAEDSGTACPRKRPTPPQPSDGESPNAPPHSQPPLVRPTPIQPKGFELDVLKRELVDMRMALDRERRSRVALEDHVIRNMELARIQSQMVCCVSFFVFVIVTW